jgi:UDP-N-acetylmuramate--alanine ligase
MNIQDFNNIYFVGAGGIGMAALERYFLAQGKKVAGYDRTPTELTAELINEGVDISFVDDINTIPEHCRDTADTLVVITPAVPHDNAILSYFRDNAFTMFKRSQVLGLITRSSMSLCFAGTHGKTTTSSMAALILDTAPVGCNAFLGGVLKNSGSNLVLSADSPFSVVEADEYDRSFHYLTPYIAVITSTDPDHLDIYGTEEAYLESFAHFTELIRPDGYLIVHTGLKLKPRTAPGVTTYTYSRHNGDFHADNIRHGSGTIVFDFVTPDGIIEDIELGVPVEINIDNAIAAMAACWLTGDADPTSIRTAMAQYQGAKRRFDFHLKQPLPGGHVLIDDYAHHPDELKQSIASVRMLYPDARLTVAFQPHLYSRTRDFAEQFGQALSMADDVILLDIYPAREEPIPGVTSRIILDAVTHDNKTLTSLDKLADTVAQRGYEVLLTVGAGDINTRIDEILAKTPNN